MTQYLTFPEDQYIPRKYLTTEKFAFLFLAQFNCGLVLLVTQ